MKTIIIACLICIIIPAVAQQKNAGIFDRNTDVGNPKIKGTTTYDSKTKTYTVSGGGYNIWFNRDEFHYTYKKLKGDFIVTANFNFVGAGKDPHRKIGWMIRPSLADTEVHISAVAHGDGLTVLQWRVQPGMNMRDPEDEIRAPEQKKYGVLQLERKGNVFTMRVADKEGAPFVVVGEHTMDSLPAETLAGIFICAHNAGVKENSHHLEHTGATVMQFTARQLLPILLQNNGCK